jgi:hypothetical protein
MRSIELGACREPPKPSVRHSPLVRPVAFLLIAAFSAASAGAQAALNVNASKPVRTVDNRMFGLNTAVWDGAYADAQTLTTLQTVDVQFLRYPGGSSSDDYDWQNNSAVMEGGSAGTTDFDTFAAYANAIGAQVIITVNYGTGTPQMAADWVTYSNITQNYGFKYWEIGNECYGTWEDDNNSPAHNGTEYATRAAQYMTAMRAADPSIKIGVVADASEDSYSNSYTTSVTNPVTNVSHTGFTPLMLSTMKSLGVMPDFLIYHSYAQNAGQENDQLLLQESVSTWPAAAASLRMQLTDYLGSAGAGIELLVTENNSISTNPGKQSTSLVNGLFYADSLGNLMQTEFNSLIWWDLHNGPGTAGNMSTSLYGWREYGDYGIENGDSTSVAGATAGSVINLVPHDPYPTYYVQKLLTHFARGGDTVVTATSNNNLLTPFAALRQDGSLSLLVINKSPTATYPANFTITGFTPQAHATVYSYGIPQDENSEENAPAASAPATGFSWENSLDGWVNQSGQPDTTATNYGLDAPFLYSLAFSTSTGVTNGTYSLACTTTNADPGDSAVIQNGTASIGSAFSKAASCSVDIYPQVAAGTTVQASIYINGTNCPYALLATVTLNDNVENTGVTFPITAAQNSLITQSLASGDYFQVGININSPVPITVYLDNFVITPLVAPTPTPTPTPIPGAASSPDIAVSTITNAGPTFSASFAPYSATVISLSGPTSAPVASGQPSSQTMASGSTVAFSFPVTGAPTPAFQWYLNGAAIPSATDSTLVVTGATAADAGSYTCTATNASGSVTSSAATLTIVTTSDPGHLSNLSARAEVGTGSNIIFGGFEIGGGGQLPVLLRASGPALVQFGIPGTLPDPQLQLYSSANAVLATNNGWAGNATIAATASAVGAFPWTSTTSHDSALVETLNSGGYTAQVAGQSGDTGDALVEIYDASAAGSFTTGGTRLINLSARVDVGTGANVLEAGFVIAGDTPLTVLIRASGPAIAAAPFNVPGTLSDPKLTLQNPATGAVYASNSGWGGDPVISGVAGSVGAFAWNVPTSLDSAIVITLPPGNYTAEAAGASGDKGVAIVEVYEVR